MAIEGASHARACPRCLSPAVARSRLRGPVARWLTRLLGIRPYRCMDCWHRFHGSARRPGRPRLETPDVGGPVPAPPSSPPIEGAPIPRAQT